MNFPENNTNESPPISSEIIDKWKNKEVELPKLPFGLINLYQNIGALMVLVLLNLLVVSFYSLLNVSIIIQVIFFPGVIMLNYFFYILALSKLSKLLNSYYDRKSPPKQGTFAREFKEGNVSNPILHYYHLRGFLYKWPVWVAKKSIFPWMVNFVLQDMAKNKISPNFIYGDAYVGLELTELQAGGVVMDGGIVSSHVVDSLYGNLTIKKVTIQENGILLTNAILTPGCLISEDLVLGPNSFAPKDTKIVKSNGSFVWGIPPNQSSYQSFLELVPEEMRKKWELRLNYS